MPDELEQRKEDVKNFLINKKSWIFYGILLIIILMGFFIRIQNIPQLMDTTSNTYMPADPDAMLVFRYSQDLLENDALPAIDKLRSYPLGFTGVGEFNFFTHVIVFTYQFMHLFDSSITFDYAFMIFPAIMFLFAALFFYLLVDKLFNNKKIALIATAFLSFSPAFLFRTMSGITDKESLATLLFFASFYFFVSSWKSKNLLFSLINAVLAGILTGATGAVWGGVNFIFLIFGLFALIELILDKFSKENLYSYTLWFILSIITMNLFFPGRINFGTLLNSVTTSLCLLSILAGFFRHFIIEHRTVNQFVEKYSKLPKSVNSFIIFGFLGLIFLILFNGPLYLIDKLKDIFTDVTKPFATGRWVLTVAENHQPYVSDWVGHFGGMFFLLSIIIGSVILFYHLVKHLSKSNRLKLTVSYTIFIFLFLFSRYKADSTFNGDNFISNFLYIGSFLFFACYFIYIYIKSYLNDQEEYEKIISLNKSEIFIIAWFIIMAIAARSAIRLVYIFTSVAMVLAAYFIYTGSIYLYQKVKENEKELTYKIFYITVLALFLMIFFWPFGNAMAQIPVIKEIPIVNSNGYLLNYYESSKAQNAGSGTTYNQQWQLAMKWVRDNTNENAVFSHWWDYGYLVQTGGKRATITDGGNTIGAWNHWTGRHVLMGSNDTEALEFLKAHNATHLLIISDEIGKYPAFSSIGSDVNYDRYSWITNYNLDPSQVKETRNSTVYLYTGGTAIDHDIIYQDKLYPKNAAGVAGFFVPIVNNANNSQVEFEQPTMVIVYNGQQSNIPINCIFYGSKALGVQPKEYKFTGGIDACIQIIPQISNNGQVNMLGSLIYLSPVVYNTQFTRLYLFGQETENFKVAYSDETQMPLAIYPGAGLRGPLKIWSISYPNNLEVPEYFYGREVLDKRVYDI
ncbi:hypothetical protein J4405_01435 [Candidatus Woesearchaeota archaeon]|nr:hypothetical protein [Candidatus Woesearchaeota archaeon]